jgi:hypothetical protein
MADEPAYQILFSIPQIKSALLMGPEGGGQLKIEFDQTSRAAIVAILDRATARGGCVFAAAVVEVEEPKQEAKEQPEVISWKNPKKLKN